MCLCVCVCTCRGQRKVLGDLLYHSLICSFEAESLTVPGAHDFGLGWHIATCVPVFLSVSIRGSYLAFSECWDPDGIVPMHARTAYALLTRQAIFPALKSWTFYPWSLLFTILMLIMAALFCLPSLSRCHRAHLLWKPFWTSEFSPPNCAVWLILPVSARTPHIPSPWFFRWWNLSLPLCLSSPLYSELFEDRNYILFGTTSLDPCPWLGEAELNAYLKSLPASSS